MPEEEKKKPLDKTVDIDTSGPEVDVAVDDIILHPANGNTAINFDTGVYNSSNITNNAWQRSTAGDMYTSLVICHLLSLSSWASMSYSIRMIPLSVSNAPGGIIIDANPDGEENLFNISGEAI